MMDFAASVDTDVGEVEQEALAEEVDTCAASKQPLQDDCHLHDKELRCLAVEKTEASAREGAE